MGESIRLYSANFTTIDAVDFAAQDAGISEGRLPDGATNLVRFPTTPTPDASNFLPLTNVVINEILSHTDPPFEDAIEFFNPTASAVNISGWYLSNNQSDPKRYLITNTTVPAGGFRVLYQYQFGTANSETDAPPKFSFNSAHGDEAYLSEAVNGNLTGYRVGLTFDAAANGVSFGRYQTSVGADFTAMSNTTFGVDSPANVTNFRTGTGKTNTYPLISPVVINELMYHPVTTNGTEDPNEEFIELYNRSNNVTRLYDPNALTNRWRLDNSVSFDFPSNTTMAAGGYLLVVAFNPATNAAALANFRAKYGTNGTVLGPYSGTLANSSESVELWRPDSPQAAPHPDVGFVPYLLADRVQYGDSAPWPTAADGGGASLQRIVPANYGNDPVNWIAGTPTPGAVTGPAALTPPTITSLTPAHDTLAGANDSLVVVATGGGTLTYQWRFNGRFSL